MKVSCRKVPYVAFLSFLILFAVVLLSQMQALDKFYCEESTIYTASTQSSPETVAEEAKDDDGWHTIQVFYGKKSLLKFKRPNQQWFSQSNQDEIVASLFQNKTNGYFVDLAANDAVYLSNTLALERQFNWKGGHILPSEI